MFLRYWNFTLPCPFVDTSATCSPICTYVNVKLPSLIHSRIPCHRTEICSIQQFALDPSLNLIIDLLSSNTIVLPSHPNPIDCRSSLMYKAFCPVLPAATYSATVLDQLTNRIFREHNLMALPFSSKTYPVLDFHVSISFSSPRLQRLQNINRCSYLQK